MKSIGRDGMKSTMALNSYLKKFDRYFAVFLIFKQKMAINHENMCGRHTEDDNETLHPIINFSFSSLLSSATYSK